MPILSSDDQIRKALRESRIVAVLGASSNPARAGYYVTKVVQRYGFRIIPVNPNHMGELILGERVYRTLDEIPGPVGIVDVFRRPSAASTVAMQVRSKGCKTVWFQPGCENYQIAEELGREGFQVVLGRCMMVECRRLL